MRKIILLFILIIFSCEKENKKSDFIGNWSSTPDSSMNIDIQFFNDSIVYDNSIFMRKYSTKWKVVGNKIYQTLLGNNFSLKKEDERNILDFKFSLKKDTLFIKRENDLMSDILTFRKIKNSYEYFENEIGLKIEFQKSNEKLISTGNNKYNFNLYISYNNNKLIAKTDIDFSENLDKVNNEAINFKSKFSEKDEKKLKYVIFIDKNVPNQKIDSIKSLLIKEIFNKIFIVKDFKENKWNEEIDWLGIYEN